MIGDYHELPIGNRLTPGPYRVAAVIYRPEPLQNLRRLDPAGDPYVDFIALPPFEVAAREPALFDPVLSVLGR